MTMNQMKLRRVVQQSALPVDEATALNPGNSTDELITISLRDTTELNFKKKSTTSWTSPWEVSSCLML